MALDVVLKCICNLAVVAVGGSLEIDNKRLYFKLFCMFADFICLRVSAYFRVVLRFCRFKVAYAALCWLMYFDLMPIHIVLC